MSRPTLLAADGTPLALYDAWPQPGVPLRGVIVLVHGLGEHAGRYAHVVSRLNQWGFAVRAYDQRGHGHSAGARGGIPDDACLLDDLARVVDSARERAGPQLPLIVLGHSLGGLVAARFVALGLRAVQGLVLSSPALDPGLSAFQKLLVAVLPRLLPGLRVGNGLNPHYLSHDPTVVQAYRADPLVHDRISARLARFIAQASAETVAQAAHWQVPTLLLYAGDDRLVNPAGSRRFAQAAPAALVQSQCFEDLYHELFNESEVAAVFGSLQHWLQARFTGPAA